MEDTKIIELYFARDEKALIETERKYGRYCLHLANSIVGNDEDAEEIVNDTYLKTWEQIPPTRPTVFRLFLAKITRNLAFSRWRYSSAQKRGGGVMDEVLSELEACIPSPGSVEEEIDLKDLTFVICAFLETQDERSKNIFLRRYFFAEETEVIASGYGMKNGTVLRSLSRTRIKLKDYLIKEGYGL